MRKPSTLGRSLRSEIYQAGAAVSLLFGFLLFGLPLFSRAEQPDRIEDNSFLIEEAYNQEPGVVQHINAFIWDPDNNTWDYTFTQEWPVVSQSHQFSYILPISRVEELGHHTGLGDVVLNYRYQAIAREGLAFAPRISLILPTGDNNDGLGTDSLGYQANLPLSIDLFERLIMHWNLGITAVPDAENSIGESASNTGFNYGMSVVYLASPTFNLMLELLGTSDEVTVGDGLTDREETFLISPGVRYAINLDSGLQIVPGVAVPLGIGPSEGEYGIIGYLSFEHSF